MAKTSQTERPQPKYYQNIDKLPLCRFIDCVVDGNVYALIISGEPTNKELKEAYEYIGEQYVSATGDSHTQMILNLQKELALLHLDHDRALWLIKALGDMRHLSELQEYKTFAKDLNSILKTRFTFSHKDQNLDKNLKSCMTRLGGIKINIGLKKAAFDKLGEKEGNSKKIDRAYFTSVLINLSNHAKYQISDKITVQEFAQRIKQMNLYYETNK